MFNVLLGIKNIIDGYYSGSPIVTYDEYNTLIGTPQIVLEDYPQSINFAVLGVNKIEHQVKISIYLQPVNLDSGSIDSTKANLLSYKNKIDQLLMSNKFSLTGSSEINFGTWDEGSSITRGFEMKENKDGLYKSEQTITVEYYEGW